MREMGREKEDERGGEGGDGIGRESRGGRKQENKI